MRIWIFVSYWSSSSWIFGCWWYFNILAQIDIEDISNFIGCITRHLIFPLTHIPPIEYHHLSMPPSNDEVSKNDIKYRCNNYSGIFPYLLNKSGINPSTNSTISIEDLPLIQSSDHKMIWIDLYMVRMVQDKNAILTEQSLMVHSNAWLKNNFIKSWRV